MTDKFMDAFKTMPKFNSGRTYSIPQECRHGASVRRELNAPEHMTIKQIRAELDGAHVEYTLPIEKSELIDLLKEHRRKCRGSLGHKGGRSRRRGRRGRRTRRCY
jgi:hypothetical protein